MEFSNSFVTLLDLILQLFDLIYNKFSKITVYVSMTLGELLDYVNSNVGYWDIPDWFINFVKATTLENLTLIEFMLGGTLALFVVLTVVKWALNIIPG